MGQELRKQVGRRILVSLTLSLVLVMGFQNCSPGFQYTELESKGSSLSKPEIEVDNAEVFNTESVNITFEVVGAAEVRCSLNGDPETDCSSLSVSYSGLPDGDHTLLITATSAQDVVTRVTKLFRKDTAPPMIVVGSTPASITSSTSAVFSFSAVDQLSGLAAVECSVDGLPFAACESPKSISGLTLAEHTFRIRAKDVAGNNSEIYSFRWSVLSAATPTVEFVTVPANVTKSTSQSFGFKGSSTVVSLECSLDNAAFAACSSPRALANLGEGQHSFRIRGISAFNVVSSIVASNWKIDLTSPSTPIITPNVNASTNLRAANFMFTASDVNGVASYQCSVDNAAFANCTSPLALSNLADGAHSLKVKAIDVVGNVSVESNYVWSVDTVTPVLMFTTQIPTSSSSTSASIGFSVSDGESGLSAVQCSLDGAAFSNCTSPANLSGLSVATHSFRVQAQDKAGNSKQISIAWTVSAPPMPSPSPTPIPPVMTGSIPTPDKIGGKPVVGKIVAKSGQIIENVHVTTASGPCIVVSDASNVIIRNSEIGPCGVLGDVTTVGIQLYNSSNVTIEKNVIHDVSSAVYAQASQHPLVIDRNYAYNIRGPMARGQLVQFNGVKNGTGQSRITCNISDAQPGVRYGVLHGDVVNGVEDHINVFGSVGTESQPIKVAYNRLRGGSKTSKSGSGIMAGDYGGQYIHVFKNTIVNVANAGIGVAGGMNITVEGNRIYQHKDQIWFVNIGSYVWAQGGVACSGVSILNNQIWTLNSNGIMNPYWNNGNCGPVVVTGNSFFDTTLSPAIFDESYPECQ